MATRDEQELIKLEQKLIRFGVKHQAIREPDLNNELMAIGLEPNYRGELKKFTKKFPLLK